MKKGEGWRRKKGWDTKVSEKRRNEDERERRSKKKGGTMDYERMELGFKHVIVIIFILFRWLLIAR